MRTAVSSWSFHPLTSTGKMTLQDCVKTAAKMGFAGFEFTDLPIDASGHSGQLALAKELRELCAELGLEVVNYTIGADLLNGHAGGSAEDEVERVKKQVDIAEALGAPGMRHDLTLGFCGKSRSHQGFTSVLSVLSKKTKAITEYAETKGIRTMVENHGYFAQDSDRMEMLVNAVAHENFGLLCDIGNFLCVDEDPIFAVGRVAPYAFLAHAKDFHVKSGMEPHPGRGFFRTRGGNYLRGAIIGHGDVPVKQTLGILKAVGYDGFVSIEFEGMEDSLLGIEVGLENLKSLLAVM